MPSLSLNRRAFLGTFITVCLAIALSFVAINVAIRTEIEAGIKDSLRRTEQSLERIRSDQKNRTELLVQLIASDSSIHAAAGIARGNERGDLSCLRLSRRIEERLHAVSRAPDCGLVAVIDSHGKVLAALLGDQPATARLKSLAAEISSSGLKNLEGTLYDVTTVPLALGPGNTGRLAVGTRFDLSSLDFPGQTGLLHLGRLVRSTMTAPQIAAVERELRPACVTAGCEIRIGAEHYLVMPVGRAAPGPNPAGPYQLLSFQSVDAAMDSLTRGFRLVFPVIGACGVLLAMCIAALTSRAVSRPLNQLIARVEASEVSGRLRQDFPEESPTREVNQLAASLNRAAHAVEHSNRLLDGAYLEFVETMAQALDARDPYTAGHSERVSEYAVAIASVLRLAPEEIDLIRIGARLHDIGKIGIPDAVLQKTGYLTADEYALVKLHPQIGKRILERVAQFDKYLPFAELHHEEFDGRGYPYGLKGHEVPLAVRVVHVADVYDALTTDRAYRSAMPQARAFEILTLCSGSHFDPVIVHALDQVLADGPIPTIAAAEQLATARLS
jgi:HD-GYP domain-containing protein (c-di-GMP phosphodiesterase class II)